MQFVGMENLSTRRLVLRRFRREDVQDYFDRIGSREPVTRGMLWSPHESIRDSADSVEKALRRYEEGKCYRWAVAASEDDRVIGVVELLRFDEKESSCSFAYMLGDDYWGKGYGTEALGAAFGFAFGKMGIEVIRADHFSTNPASGAVMRKLGMRYTGREPGAYEKNGQRIDAMCYEIRKEEFQGGI